MTLTPRPFFWSITTRGGREIASGIATPSHPLPRQHEQVAVEGQVFTVVQVRWNFAERQGPVLVSVLVELATAMFEADARAT